jgi:hypothetical protein
MTRTRLGGYELLSIIGGHRDIFAEQQAAVDKAATAILLSRIKSKIFKLDQSRQLLEAIGPEFFALALDILSDADLAKLLKKLDPHYSPPTPTDSTRLRHHAIALAGGQAQPAPKPPKPSKKSAAPKTTAKKGPEWPSSVSAKPVRRAS